MTQINLPAIIDSTSDYLLEITTSLNIPRDILASDEEIKEAWERLPRVITKIPTELRTKGVVKMCIAVSVWLFDSWINYIWNEAIIELRNKIKRFWLSIVWEITDRKEFDEVKLNDLQDSELLNLCLQLNLITEDAFFYLDQCRDIRNNFSAAHPTIWELDENELLNFTNRCIKYALCNDYNPVGINIGEFISSIKLWKFDDEQIRFWKDKIIQTHEAQRELLFGNIYWIYCDKNSSEEARVNSINLSKELSDYITPIIKSNLISLHQWYILKQNTAAKKVSETFFEKLWLLSLLWETETHTIVKKACKNLFNAHLSMNNFYNEPPFAERLYDITNSIAVPDTVKYEFIEVILTCGMWNWFWVSHKAFYTYKKLVSNFSPKEIAIMFKMITDESSYVWQRLKYSWSRKSFLKDLITNIDKSSVPTNVKNIYEKWLK